MEQRAGCSLWFTIISIVLAIITWRVFQWPGVTLVRIGTGLELIGAFLAAPEFLGAARLTRIEKSSRAVADWVWETGTRVAHLALFVAPGAIGFPIKATLAYISVGGDLACSSTSLSGTYSFY